jgi:pimeloyl-ACP methyl ester carboxylesterase
VLLHGVGTSSGEWSWVLPELARNNLVYAIDLPGYDGSYEPPNYLPAFTASFVNSFLVVVGRRAARPPSELPTTTGLSSSKASR